VLMYLLLAILSMQSNEASSAQSGRLAACPDTPNCVSSISSDKKHFIAPLLYTGSRTRAWQVLISTVLSLPRSKLTEQSGKYLHFELSSIIFRFTDDVEMMLDPEKKEIQIRSGSRTGYSDFGVNRRRVETIRKLFMRNLGQEQEQDND